MRHAEGFGFWWVLVLWLVALGDLVYQLLEYQTLDPLMFILFGGLGIQATALGQAAVDARKRNNNQTKEVR